MSALHPKADMCSATRYVRLVPKADIPIFIRLARIGALLHAEWHVKTERLCGFEVDDQIELGWRLHGQIARFRTLEVRSASDVEMLFRQHFRRDLRERRFTMEFAQSGDMALQRIADAAGVSIILILSDINMPGMTGLELLPKAKAARPDVPVIMITAYGDAETKQKALEAGAEALFTKPIDFGALRSEIDTRVERAA
jgi:CheY-like chemotaxis protein